ncbi:FISUMP domain-containing protein [Fibrobacter sp. UWB11]|uniref:FISUMP domain-containing protein n=2 Tax=unclassified Fibrobacter TaxID=2634177 RepID=UPI0009F8C789|nr:FISUMP domain-containing protein [Fibrobacter sp. UWB11]
METLLLNYLYLVRKKMLRNTLMLVSLACVFVACGDDSSSSPVVESSSSEIAIIVSSSSVKSSSSERKSSVVELSSSAESSSSSSYVEKHLAWDYMNPAIFYGEFTDERDGHVYKYIVHSNFRIMAENLNFSDSVNYPNLRGQTWCYQDNLDSCSKYGRYYTWSAALNINARYNTDYYRHEENRDFYLRVQGICPKGWELFVNEGDWRNFIFKYINPNNLCAKKGWDENLCTDSLGFAALPNGFYKDGKFEKVGEEFRYWEPWGQSMETSNHAGQLGGLLLGDSWGWWGSSQTLKSVGGAVRCYQMIPKEERSSSSASGNENL